MSVTSGYYNSQNGDRKYTAEQMSSIFNGIISDGVFANVGSAFSATADESNIIIGIGRAWFNNTWVYNDALLTLPLEPADVLLGRYDAVVIEIDRSEAVRWATIKIIKGVPSSSPAVPTITNSGDLHQHPIAYIYRKADTNTITQVDVRYLVGTDVCPFATGIVDVNPAFAQWQVQWEYWFSEMKKFVVEDDVRVKMLELESRIHTEMYRGSNLGTSITDTQISAIRSGDFTDMWLGDYWVINGFTWRIVDFNYWYDTGGDGHEYAFKSNHVVIMPDESLAYGAMNSTSAGYVGSEMYTTGLWGARDIIKNTFGDILLTHREYLSTQHDEGVPTAGDWFDSTAELANEIMMYGTSIWSNDRDTRGTGSTQGALYTINKTQLALFRVRPEFIMSGRRRQWLRDIARGGRNDNTSFAMVSDNGEASVSKHTNSRGVRPVFAIG